MFSRTLVPVPFVAALALVSVAGCSTEDDPTPHPAGSRVAWCRMVEPAVLETAPGRAFSATARVRVPGLTDLTPGPDPDVNLVAKIGWGPYGTMPSNPGASGDWTWRGASPKQDWDGAAAGEPDVDEYRATTSAPGVGRYGLAFAFSGDGGRSWLLCDLDGAEDAGGFSPENSAELVVRSVENMCDPNPCTVTPLPACEGTKIVFYEAPGECTPLTLSYECTYPSRYGDDCGAANQACVNGTCVTPDPIEFCRHEGPELVAFAGEPITFEGLVLARGLTDATTGVDPSSKLKASFGFGWVGSTPGDDGWVWLEGDEVTPGPPEWTDEELPASLQGADLYRARFTGAPPGQYATAWRFSADSGATWTYCDLDGAGVDEALGGTYDPAQAGRLSVPED